MLEICDNHFMNIDFFASTLKKIRSDKNITQQQLAELIGLSRYTIQDWEAAKRTPSLDMLPKIAKALDTTTDRLVGEPENMATKENTVTFSPADLKAMRKEIGISTRELARQVGAQQSVIEDYEAGRQTPDKTMIEELAVALGCEVDELTSDHTPSASETAEMMDRIVKMLSSKNPDIILHFRDIDLKRESLAPEDVQAIADTIALATGKATKEIDKRLRKQSRHGEL